MALVPAKCTQCGGQVEVDDSKEAGICKHCGMPFITEKAITNYVTNVTNVDNSTNIYIGSEKSIQKYVNELDAYEKLEEDENIAMHATELMEKHPSEPMAYLVAAAAYGKMMLRLASKLTDPETVYVGEIAGKDVYLKYSYIVKLYNKAVKLSKSAEDIAVIKNSMSQFNRQYSLVCINMALRSMRHHLTAYNSLKFIEKEKANAFDSKLEKYWEVTDFGPLKNPWEKYLNIAYGRYINVLEKLISDLESGAVNHEIVDGYEVWQRFDRINADKIQYDNNNKR